MTNARNNASPTCSAAEISTVLCKRQKFDQNMTATVYVHIVVNHCHNTNSGTISTTT